MMTEDLSAAVARLEEKINNALIRIDEVKVSEMTLHEISRKIDVLTENVNGRLERVEVDLKELNDRITRHGREIDELRQMPARRWETLIGQIISLLVAGGAGFLFSKIL